MQINKLCEMSDDNFIKTINSRISVEKLRQIKNSKEFNLLSDFKKNEICKVLDFFDGNLSQEDLWNAFSGKVLEGVIISKMPNRLYRKAFVKIDCKTIHYDICGIVKLDKIRENRFLPNSKIKLKLSEEFGIFEFITDHEPQA